MGETRKAPPAQANRCAKEIVTYIAGWPSYRQCLRTNGQGFNGKYCGQHAKPAECKCREQSDTLCPVHD